MSASDFLVSNSAGGSIAMTVHPWKLTATALLSSLVIVGTTSCADKQPPVVASQVGQGRETPGYSVNTPNLVLPKAIRIVPPRYTREAMQASVMGEIELLVRIGADGRPERATVTRSLDKVYGLDEQAMFAIGRSIFQPAKLNGRAVPVDDAKITLSFRLQ
jgi:TonB family protein